MHITFKNQKTSLLPKIQPTAHRLTVIMKPLSLLIRLSQMSISGSSFSKHNATAFDYFAESRHRNAKDKWEDHLPKKKSSLLKLKTASPSCLLPSTTFFAV
jgi:hypothetical protein